MTPGERLFRIAAGAGALLGLGAAGAPIVLSQVQGGLWELSGAPGAKAPVRVCVADVAALARFEHRGRNCQSRILKSSGSSTEIDYNCGFGGFGHSEVAMITPRSLRIDTQGISEGLPFAYVLQARRVGDCPVAPVPQHH